MDKYYDMGADHLAYAGMDDAGEMSCWYVLNAIGIYTYSPADARYLVCVPLFPRVILTTGDGRSAEIIRQGEGETISQIRCGDHLIKGWFVDHDQLFQAKRLIIDTE